MAYEAKNIGNVPDLGDIYEVSAPLDEQLKSFAKVGIKTIASPNEIAQIRLAGTSLNGSRTNVAPIAIKGGKTILVRDSPFINPLMAASAVTAHRQGNFVELGRDFYDTAYEIAKSELGIVPEDRTAIEVSQSSDFGLTADMDESRFLLGKFNNVYFEKFVKDGKSGKIPFYNLTGNSKDRTTVNYLWFVNPQIESDLNCRSRGLYDDYGAFGVLRSGEASAQKDGYSLTEIENANSQIIPVVFASANISGLTSLVSGKLSESLLSKLREQ